eukprot:jgi/Botrbrau1/11314/Bobra.0038s0075.1
MCSIWKEACKKLCSWGELLALAASDGQWECIQILERVGCGERWMAADSAARSGQLEILQNLVHLDASLLERPELFIAAAQGGSLACLEFLEQAGCPWDKTGGNLGSRLQELRGPPLLPSSGVDGSIGTGTWHLAWIRQSGPEALPACRLCMTAGTSAQPQRVVPTRSVWQSSTTVWRAHSSQYSAAVHRSCRHGTLGKLLYVERRCFSLCMGMGGTLDSKAAEIAGRCRPSLVPCGTHSSKVPLCP